MLYIRQTLSQKLKERGVGVQMLISEGGRGISLSRHWILELGMRGICSGSSRILLFYLDK